MSSIQNEKIARLREQFFILNENLVAFQKSKEELESEVARLKSILERLEQGETIQPKEMYYFNLEKSQDPGSPLQRFALSKRIEGVISHKEKMVQSLSQSIITAHQSIRNLEICPLCNGSGFSISKTYERDESMVLARQDSEVCETCKGVGKISLA